MDFECWIRGASRLTSVLCGWRVVRSLSVGGRWDGIFREASGARESMRRVWMWMFERAGLHVCARDCDVSNCVYIVLCTCTSMNANPRNRQRRRVDLVVVSHDCPSSVSASSTKICSFVRSFVVRPSPCRDVRSDRSSRRASASAMKNRRQAAREVREVGGEVEGTMACSSRLGTDVPDGGFRLARSSGNGCVRVASKEWTRAE